MTLPDLFFLGLFTRTDHGYLKDLRSIQIHDCEGSPILDIRGSLDSLEGTLRRVEGVDDSDRLRDGKQCLEDLLKSKLKWNI